MLHIFPTIAASMSHLTTDQQIDLLVNLRLAEKAPGDGILVAEDAGRIVGIIYNQIAEHFSWPHAAWWRALRPLGWFGLPRFLYAFIRTLHRPAPHEMYSGAMAIVPEYRRKGLAQALITASEQFGRDRGKTIIYGYVHYQNTASLNVLAKLGHHPVPMPQHPIMRLLRGEAVFKRIEKALYPIDQPTQESLAP